MGTFLFDSIVFGPVTSRRLGNSLGINLLPVNKKICNFNCLYCECGLTLPDLKHAEMPSRETVSCELEKWLMNNRESTMPVDSITFAGNGEPTLHPEFEGIIDDTVALRDRYGQSIRIAVLSNATRISDQRVFSALLKTDLNILKLDSGCEETLLRINCPIGPFHLGETIENLRKFKGKLIIQTLFFRGTVNHRKIDNTTPEEIEKWIETIERIQPESVMIYTIARDTPVGHLEKATRHELNEIARQAERHGISVQISA